MTIYYYLSDTLTIIVFTDNNHIIICGYCQTKKKIQITCFFDLDQLQCNVKAQYINIQ